MYKLSVRDCDKSANPRLHVLDVRRNIRATIEGKGLRRSKLIFRFSFFIFTREPAKVPIRTKYYRIARYKPAVIRLFRNESNER